MSEEARELFSKLVDNVDGVSILWISPTQFKITDILTVPSETRTYNIEEV